MLPRLFVVALFVSFGIVHFPARAADKPVPAELVKYIVDARKASVKDPEIEEIATKAGWPVATVADAFAYVSGLPKEPSDTKVALTELPRPTTGTELPVAAPITPDPLEHSPAAPASSTGTPAIPNAPPTANPADGAARQPVVDHGVPDEYQIGAGDVLQISVWREPEASIGSVVVRPDGKISMPLLKEVSVVGLTPKETEKLITERLAKLIKAPDVTIIVTGTHSSKIYAVGAVKKEGPIAYTYRMSVMQAISEAGGLTDYAKRKKIYILRNEGGREYRLPFDYDAALKGERMELNLQLVPGDTLVVPH